MRTSKDGLPEGCESSLLILSLEKVTSQTKRPSVVAFGLKKINILLPPLEVGRIIMCQQDDS